MIYLDNASTTKIRKEVVDEMMPYLTDIYGNPTAKYYKQAVNAKNAIDLARHKVASLLNCREDEVIFTSGSTEGNNMIIKGVADYYVNKGKHIITTTIEHASIIETCKFLESKGYKITYLSVNDKGLINIDELRSAINKDTILVSVMWVNNEIGSINDIKKISEICQDRKVLFHTDATQAIGKINVDLAQYSNVNFLTLSGHKIYGPKGIGATIIKKDTQGLDLHITPLIHGGGQEFNYRSGTLAVHNIVGLGKACELIESELSFIKTSIKTKHLILQKALEEYFNNYIEIINDFEEKVYGIISARFIGINNQILLKKISALIAASTGSTCSINKPSHVLRAIGKDDSEIRQIIRFSFSHDIDVNLFRAYLKKLNNN